MRNLLPPRSTLLLVLLASAAMARGRDVNVRSAYIFGRHKERVDRLYVTPDAATILRFQQPCDAAGTKMIGWEGRFEPVACAGKRVLIEPIQALEPEDRFLLVVRLADGTEVPFTLMGATRKEGEWPDQQVNVFFEPDTREALNDQLKNARERENGLLDDVRRFYREDTPDHALAKLVALGAIRQTPFRLIKKRVIKSEGEETTVRIYKGKAKAAVLFTVTNHDPSKPWNLLEARLVTIRPGEDPEPYVFGDKKPFALRADRDEIAPGESGNVAIVVDRSAFKTENGNAELILEIYRKDGWRQAYVVLDERLTR
ncbi:DUF2381 family protein [Archangium violaceum]|uniref:DUF2381 family protein n=1 Tax=Archangium violaceum Cb vi76 TaxID=1406225 RepID=A0A084SVR2_9BACT|nr:DUF2381 family protein [Archangium violaceum]KFA92547.1 hypothetical protein Q664_14735 [Archangium violaceum Cb vi76]